MVCNQLFCPYFSPWHTFSISCRYRQEDLRREYVMIPVLSTYFLKYPRWGFETLTLYRTKNPKIHTLFRKTTSTEHTAELVRVLHYCPGGAPKNSWWECTARFSKSWPFFRQICSYILLVSSKTIPDSKPKWTKSIPFFSPKRENHTLREYPREYWNWHQCYYPV